MRTFQGIDVSVFQGKIDWPRVRAAGIQFAFIRAGWCTGDGVISKDARLDQNLREAAAAGLDAGVYLYSYAKTPAAAVAAAENLLELVRPFRLTYPVVFDLEDSMYHTSTPQANARIAKAFLDTVRQHGYHAMYYTNHHFAQSRLDSVELLAYDAWIAQYSAPFCSIPCGIWQHSGNGVVDGIAGTVNLNLAYRDYSSPAGQNHASGSQQLYGGKCCVLCAAELAKMGYSHTPL